MKPIVALALIVLATGCANTRAPIAAADIDRAVRTCPDGQKRQREIAFRRQRVKQSHARGLSARDDEAALKQDLEALERCPAAAG